MELFLNLQFIYIVFLAIISSIILHTLVSTNSRSYNNKKCKTKTIPQPLGALPVIGHLHLLGGHGTTLARTLGAMADTSGPIFGLKLGQHRAIVMSNWELIKECFTNYDMNIATRPNMAISKYLYYDFASFFISPYNRYWRELRKVSTIELLSNKRLEEMKHVRIFEVNSCLKVLYEKCVNLVGSNECNKVAKVSLKKWFEYLGFNIALSMIVGKRFSYDEYYRNNNTLASRFMKAIERATHLSGLPVPSDFLPWIEWMDFGGFIRDMKKTHKEIDMIVGHWLDEHIQKREDILERGGTSIDEGDFMDVMLSNIAEPFAMSTYSKETIIKATAVALLLTGSESTSITLTWAISLLINNPTAHKLAQEEMDKQVGKQRWVQESDITNLPYLQAIVKETLRLYPPSPLTGPREAQKDCQINGHNITKGTRLIVNIWKLHRDPLVWSDPDKFRPERFIDEYKNVDFKGHQFGYIPFSLGRRNCPGMNFGLQVVHLMLARLVQGFNIWAENGGPIDMKEGLGLALPKVGPLDVILAPRLSTELYEAL